MKRRSHQRIGIGHFAGIPDVVIDSLAFRSLSGSAAKLLIIFARNYRGKNNGDLSASQGALKEYGFMSEHTVQDALDELVRTELIVRTRLGYYMNPGSRCALYALTWNNIDECPGRNLEIKPTIKPWRRFEAEPLKDPVRRIRSARRERKAAREKEREARKQAQAKYSVKRPMQKVHTAQCGNSIEDSESASKETASQCRNNIDTCKLLYAESAYLIKLPSEHRQVAATFIELTSDLPRLGGASMLDDCELLEVSYPSLFDFAFFDSDLCFHQRNGEGA